MSRLSDRAHIVTSISADAAEAIDARDEEALDGWADDVTRFCDAVGIDEPIVIGHSLGGPSPSASRPTQRTRTAIREFIDHIEHRRAR
jgi:pimeloyl-ACP methyl ester carboxylesterase